MSSEPERRFATRTPINFPAMVLLLTTALLIQLPATASEPATSAQSSPQAQTLPAAVAGPLEGKPILLRVVPVDLTDFRKRFCKGVLTDKRLRGQVLIYRSSLEPVYGKSRGCEDGGFRLENAMSPSAPTPVRSLLIPWDEFAGIDAPDPTGRAGAVVVYLIGLPLSLSTGAGVMLGGSELGGLFVMLGGSIGTGLLAGKMEGQRIRVIRTDTQSPLSNLLPTPSGGKP